MGIFLVERYWPGVTSESFSAAFGRLNDELARLDADGVHIRHLGSTLVPDEETVFCVFEATDHDVVASVNDRAGFAYDRLSACVHLQKELSP